MRDMQDNKPPSQAATPLEGAERPASRIGELCPDAFPGDFTVRDEANALVVWAFRNGPLEDLHAGKYLELLEDKSLSRITDAEMKALMINACRTLEKLRRL